MSFRAWAAALTLLGVLSFGVGAEPVELEFWYGEVADYALRSMQEIVDRFNSERDDIVVRLVHKGNSNFMYQEALQVAILGGVAPDIAYLNYYDVRDLSLQGDWFIPLNDLLSPEELARLDEIFLPPAQEAFRIGQTWFGLPWRMDTRGLYYNAQMFEQSGLDPGAPPRYIDELDEYTRKMTVRNADNAVTRIGFYPRGNNFSREIPWLWAFGGEFFDFESLRPTFTGAPMSANLEAVEWIDGYAKTYGTWTAVPAGRFLQGQLGMIVQSTSSLAQFAQQATFTWGIGVIPTKRGVDLFSTTFPLGPAIPRGARHPREAARFLVYLTNADLQVEWYQQTSMPPTTWEAMRAILPLTDDPRARFLIETMFPVSRVMPPFATDILDVFQPKADRMRNGEISPAAVLEESQAELEAYFRNLQRLR